MSIDLHFWRERELRKRDSDRETQNGDTKESLLYITQKDHHFISHENSKLSSII